jgi:hypothetical protein
MGDASTCADTRCTRQPQVRGLCKSHYESRRKSGRIVVQPKLSREERFWQKVDASGACWEWVASKNKDGYGTFNGGPALKTVGAHQYAWMLLVGPIGGGLELDHLCWNRACVSPEHLEPVPHKENVRRGKGTRRVFCAKGHRLADNQYASGRRGCRACTREDNTLRSRRVRGSKPRQLSLPKPSPEPKPWATRKRDELFSHCRKGHEFTMANTYIQTYAGKAVQRCRTCKASNQAKYLARKAAAAA